MAELLGVDYDVLALDMTESESRQRALVSDPTPPSTPPALPEPGAIARPPADTIATCRDAGPACGNALDGRERRGRQSFWRRKPGGG
jgi:hypothetical protein